MKLTSNSLSELNEIAEKIISVLPNSGLVIINGEMGSGKTTLISTLCKKMGVEDRVSSPTFSLVNEYLLPDGKPLYHFDFYRIEDPEEALDIGVDEYFYSDRLCFVEWAEQVKDLIPEDKLVIDIVTNEEGSREYNVSV